MQHAILTAIFCVIIFMCNGPLPLFVLPAGFYIGRELAQAEYRYMDYHNTNRDNLPLLVWFYKEAWTLKGLLDWLLPTLASILFYGLYSYERTF